MSLIEEMIQKGKSNFVLIGEAGCGKSELALNLALYLSKIQTKSVHLFDLDMTKPLFRSRDIAEDKKFEGINIHFERQFYDAPTVVGGVNELLNDDESIVVLDVGGDDIGARSLGGYMLGAGRLKSTFLYVLNSFRPFCRDIDHVDRFLGEILAVSHIGLDEIHLVDNPNVGVDTTIEDVLGGHKLMNEIVSPYKNIEMTCVKEEYVEEAKAEIDGEIFSMNMYLTYPWLQAVCD
ncbi:MAG: ATP-binding protein [Lachnospiraceae bacterium]|nr:ATP-binding protein [Lachnospiraceae bacterium]